MSSLLIAWLAVNAGFVLGAAWGGPMIVLNIKPLGSGRFAAFVCGKPIVRSSRQPFLDAARALLVRGSPADATLVMVHSNRTQSLRATLAEAARLSVKEGEERPRFVRWKPNALAEAAG